MLDETYFIPFSTEDLPQGPWLVFAPHSDDESFGMGGSLIRAKESNISTSLVILTDGALGGEIGGLTNIRKEETKQVAQKLNLDNLEFWQHADRGLSISNDLIDKVVETLLKVQPKSIFFPAVGEFHPDHRATAFIVWEGIQKSGYKNNVYSYEISTQQQPVNLLIDISSVFKQKQELMGIYKSQLAENNYIDIVTSINRARTYTLSAKHKYAEAFYKFSSVKEGLNTIISSQCENYFVR